MSTFRIPTIRLLALALLFACLSLQRVQSQRCAVGMDEEFSQSGSEVQFLGATYLTVFAGFTTPASDVGKQITQLSFQVAPADPTQDGGGDSNFRLAVYYNIPSDGVNTFTLAAQTANIFIDSATTIAGTALIYYNVLLPFTIPAGVTQFYYAFASDNINMAFYYNPDGSVFTLEDPQYAYTSTTASFPLSYTITTNFPGNFAEGVLICSAARGDPLFTGLHGQQFYVAGEDGQVLNIISTATLIPLAYSVRLLMS